MAERSSFLRPPRTEQEVVCLFGALLDDLDWPIVVERVQTAFPDCLLRRLDNDKLLRVEFELFSSHFLRHGHAPADCDLIVCWRDDGGPGGIEILELRKIVDERRPDLLIHTADPDVAGESELLADARALGASEETLVLLRGLIAESRRRGWDLVFQGVPDVVLTVGRRHEQFFKVYSPDRLALPLARLDSRPLFSELAERLNSACPRLQLRPADERSKGRGGRLAELFGGPQDIERFLDVWVWLQGRRGE